jgi:phage-related protein
VSAAGEAILLHAIVKKTQRTPAADLALARERMQGHAKAEKEAAAKGRGAKR